MGPQRGAFDRGAAPAGQGRGLGDTPQQDYLRIWLSDMFLARDRAWFRDRHPAVHASVRLTFANWPGLEFTAVARPPEGMLGPGERRDYPLTPLIPYSGGVVELEAGSDRPTGLKRARCGDRCPPGLLGVARAPARAGADGCRHGLRRIDQLLSSDDGVVLGVHAGFHSASEEQDAADDHGVLRKRDISPS